MLKTNVCCVSCININFMTSCLLVHNISPIIIRRKNNHGWCLRIMFKSIYISNSHITMMVTSLLVFMIVELTLTRQLYRPESVTLNGEKEYVDDV